MHRIICRIAVPFTDFSWPIYSYGLMMMLGFICALALALRRARKEDLDPDVIWDLWMWSLIFGIVGARGLFILQNWQAFQGRSPLAMLYFWEGGLVFYGGVATAALAAVVYLKRKHIPVLKVMDVLAPSLALGLAFGRVGCFLNGCCFGKLSNLPWPLAVRFPRGAEPIVVGGGVQLPPLTSPPFLHHVLNYALSPLASHSLPIHPVQLYASLSALIVFGILTWFFMRRRHQGEVMLLFLIVYPVARFLLELLRDDNLRTFTGLTLAQNMSIAAFLMALPLFLRLRWKGRIF